MISSDEVQRGVACGVHRKESLLLPQAVAETVINTAAQKMAIALICFFIIHHPFMVRAIRPILLFSITLRNRSLAFPQEQTFQ